MAALAGVEAVTTVPCTAEFWAELGVAPDTRFTKRQNLTLTHLYRQTAEGWLLNVDGDELLYFAGQTIAEAVDGFDDDLETVRVETAEAIQTEAEDGRHHFRLSMDRMLARQVYEGNAILFARRKGMVGHHVGKSFIRAGIAGATLRQHWGMDAKGGELKGRALGAADGAYLLHYLDNGYEQWRAKVDWRAASNGFHPHLKARVDEINASDDPEAGFRALYTTLFCFDADRLARLEAAGCHLALALDDDAVSVSIPANTA
jgi:hypothetical protein